MDHSQIIWLASYPRSGNTLLRTILWNCFGLRSGSIYPGDLGDEELLKAYVGHIDQDPNGRIHFPAGNIRLIKTHEIPSGDDPAIYTVRDGRAAYASLSEFYKNNLSLEAAISGHSRFGTWSNHLTAWKPWSRPNTLLLMYEEMISDLPRVLDKIESFIGRKAIASKIPDREFLTSLDERMVRKKSDWREIFSAGAMELFNQTNMEMMCRMGYYEKKNLDAQS